VELFHHSNTVGLSRCCRRVERRSFAVPLMSAFHGYHVQRGMQHQQLRCNPVSSLEMQNETDDNDEDGYYNGRGTDCGAEVDRPDDGSRGRDTLRDVAAGDTGGPVNQHTSKKHDYSVAELLRNDRLSSSATYDDQTEAGPSDNRRYREAVAWPASPLKTTDSAFHIWNVEHVGRPTAPLQPPPFALPTPHHRHWTDWMMSDSWRCPEFDGDQRQYFGVFDTPPVNFMPTYRHLRRGTELQLPLSTFSQQLSIPRRSRNCQLRRTYGIILSYSL